MSSPLDIPTALLALPALSVAAGVDLYLTLLLLGLLPHTGLWGAPLPGALGDLDSLGVHLVACGFYVGEVLAERWPLSSLVWNAFHAVIRPLAGVLLALLILEGQPVEVAAVGAVLAGLLSSVFHGVRTGTGVLFWLRGATSPRRGLLSVGEDVGVLALVTLTLDQPAWAATLAVVATCAALVRAPSDLRAFRFAMVLGLIRAFGSLRQPRWRVQEDFPRWLADELEADVAASPALGLKGSPAGAVALPGAPRFARGWLVVLGNTPSFAYRSGRTSHRVALDGVPVHQVLERPLFRRVEFGAHPPARSAVCVSRDGPGLAELGAAFRG